MYFRKVPNPQTMSVPQVLGRRKVLGTVVNTAAEALRARKGLVTLERLLRVQKVNRVLLSPPPRGETGLELCTVEKAAQGGVHAQI